MDQSHENNFSDHGEKTAKEPIRLLPDNRLPRRPIRRPDAAGKKKRQPIKTPTLVAIIAVCLVVATLLGAVGGFFATSVFHLLGSGGSVAYAVARAEQSAVSIFVYDAGSTTAPSGSGSGVIWDRDGYIVTNNHVVDGGVKFSVVLYDGTVCDATLVGTDWNTDLAVLKISERGLRPAERRTRDYLQRGDTVIAIGNPLGEFAGTVTTGCISGFEREIEIEGIKMKLLQHDAAVSPGNSGGGLFDDSGNLIGIINAKSLGSDVEGIGFAIPMSVATPIVEELIEHGMIEGRAQLGVTVLTYDPPSDSTLKQQYRIGIEQNYPGLTKYLSDAGIYVVDPGVNATLKMGDKILTFNDAPVSSLADIRRELQNFKAGDYVKVQIRRRSSSGQTGLITLTEYVLLQQRANPN